MFWTSTPALIAGCRQAYSFEGFKKARLHFRIVTEPSRREFSILPLEGRDINPLGRGLRVDAFGTPYTLP